MSWDLKDECILDRSQHSGGDVADGKPYANQHQEKMNGLCVQIRNEDSLDHRTQMKNTWW